MLVCEMQVQTRGQKQELEEISKAVFKIEKSTKNHYDNIYADVNDRLQQPAIDVPGIFKKRQIKHPTTITVAKPPEYYPDSFEEFIDEYETDTIDYLAMALVVCMHGDIIQPWFFDAEHVNRFLLDINCYQFRPILYRMIEQLEDNDHQDIDNYIDEVRSKCSTRTFQIPEKLPKVLRFAFFILSLEGTIDQRLQLHLSPNKLRAFISSIVDEKVLRSVPQKQPRIRVVVDDHVDEATEVDDDDVEENDVDDDDVEENDVDEDDVDEDAALVDELEEALGERSSFLIDDDDDESDSSFYREIHFERGFEPVVIDLTNDNRKRNYAEIIDLTKSDDEEEEEEDNEKEDTNKRSRH